MPPFQYWVSGAALWLAGSFAITVILAIVGLKEMMSSKIIVFLILLALLMMFFGWWTAAEQEAASAKREKQLDDMAETLALIKSSLPPQEIGGAVANISTTTNTQIRKMVSDLTSKMRIFEGGLKANRSVKAPPTAPQDRHTAWVDETNKMLRQHAQAENEFRVRLLPEALSLRDEMSKRLGIMPPYPANPRNVALDFGMLAGPSPISDAADYLDGLARQLPP